ncbi:P-loop containing nucleoside triphosphate hydrolase protein [Gautieria morchelliformis]|nr:P-loop containing nucleoside triphosphate hydrolase protein [Gautieria morchelliformis]
MKVTEKHRVHQFDHARDKLIGNLKVGFSEFSWAGTDFLVYKVTWSDPAIGLQVMYIVLFKADGKDNAERDKVGEELITAAYRWNLGTKDEIYVFSDGHWSKDKKLWNAIQLAQWDNLVLDQEFIAGLKRDTDTFFSSREIYESLEIPWKRGLLLLGPPGNGKTESIKVLLKESGMLSLYVKSFSTNRGSEAGIRSIFEFARRQAPCILVIEDLDSMVTPSIRSFFLNEIDGLEKNEGILTIATSNHPELIDDAILNRPSRFDVKYTFRLPSYELRKAYIAKWIVKTKKLHGIDFTNEMFIREMAEQTEGFSFAFLKELFVSFLLRTAHDKASGKKAENPEVTMKAQIKQLVAQIETGENAKRDVGHGSSHGAPPELLQARRWINPGVFGGTNAVSDW